MKKSVIFATVVVGLFASVAKAETCTATNVVVAPLIDANWTQNAPYNDYSPKGKTVFTSGWEAGCVAIAAAQELYYWQWPWRLDAVHETSHPVLNESNLALRFDGNVPFDWESMQNSYGDGATLKQKHAAAHLVLACQSLVQMRFVSGGGEAMKNLPGTMEWFEYAGQITPRASDANLAALQADMEFGSPVQTGINFKGYGGHEVVGLGYATGTNTVGDAKNLIWLNLGWGGGSDGWYDLAEATEGETIIKSVQLGFRPIKSVQIEPVAPVSGNSVTLNWHLPNCYTNKITGFTVAKKTPSASTTTWSDDFSTGGKGRSSNTNEVIVTNERLYGWQGTASGVYTYDEVLLLTESSVLSYKYHDDYMAGMSVRVEAKIGDGSWQTISEPPLHGGWNYAAATTETVNLGAYAGKGARFRFVVEYVNASIWPTGVNAANVWFDDLSVSNVKTFETVSTDSTIAASARSTTFSGLTTDETYAFSVTPIMSDGSAAVTQTATTTIGTPAAAPTINAVTMSPKGSNLVQEGFYADIAMGWNIIDVACSESVTSLEAFISHQSVLPQSKIEVVDNGSGSFSINIDATEVAAKWANQKMILTLKATNATGESAYKDVELCLKASGVPEGIPGGKVWTGEDAMFGEDYTAKWAGGVVPSDGDHVTFYVADGEYGAMMNLNLSSATTLGYVYATGLGQLTISGTSYETLTANVLKNDIQVEINSSKFKINKAIPSANIVIDSGSCLDCEIDQAYSGYLKKVSNGYVSALTDSSLWRGTVVFANYTAAGQSPSNYGNAESTVRLNGVAGWLANNTTFTPAVELVDDGATPALNWNNGSTSAKETFKKLKGSGTFKTSGSGGAAERVVINDIDDFTGSFDLSLKRIAIGTDDPTTSNNGSITVNSGKSITVHGGSAWRASGGFYFGGSQTITVNGTLNGAISANGIGTVLALAPTATVTAASLSFANNTIRLAKTTEASPTFSVTGAAILTNATIEVALADGMSADDSIALMSAGSFEGVDSATLEGLDGYSLEVSGGTLYATKPAEIESPAAAAVWEDDFSSTALAEFDGFSIDDWQQTHGANMSSVTIDRANQGLLVDFTEAKGYVTVLVKYSNLAASSSNKRVLFATTANSDYTRDRCGIRLQTDSKVIGLWNASTTANNDADYGSASTDTVPSAGTLAFVYDKTSGTDAGGVSAYVAASGESLPSSAIWSNHALKAGDIYGLAVGGMCRDAAVSGVEAAQGMTITGLAIFTNVLSVAEMNAYKWPSQLPPVDKEKYSVTPEAVWYRDFKTTAKTNDAGRVYTLAVSGTTAPADDAYGSTLTIGDAAAVVDVRNGENGGDVTVLVKYKAAPNTVNAQVVTFGETLSNGVKIDVGAYTTNALTLAVNRSWGGGNNKWVPLNTGATLSATGGYLLCARKYNDMLVYVGDSLDGMTGGSTAAPGDITFTCNLIQAVGIGGPSGLPDANAAFAPFTGFVVEKVVVFNGYYTPDEIRYVEIPEDADTLAIGNGKTWKFAAGTTRTYTNIGTLNTGATIAITNAAELAEGSYMLATWTTAQKLISSYGHVGSLDVSGLPEGLSAELVYGAKAIYLRVWNPATQAAKGTIKLWPYGDSITEGFNMGGTKANYRVLLAQKLSLLGYNVEMVGTSDKIQTKDGDTSAFAYAIDPSGQTAANEWQWHSAKHGGTAGPTSASSRSNERENVDTLCAQVGNPDAVLLLIGVNDLAASGQTPALTFGSWTNVINRLVANLPNSKIIATTLLYGNVAYQTRANQAPNITTFNGLVRDFMADMPSEWVGHVIFLDMNTKVGSYADKAADDGIIYNNGSDWLHPDWWGHDQMAEGWLSVITNQFTSTQTFPSATVPAAPTADKLGAATKSELADYRDGYTLCRTIDAASTNVPSVVTGEGATEGIEKVAYFVEYVRADNNAHKWVWVDMDAFGTTIDDVGLPTTNHQQVVTKLHVKSNHNGIDDVAANDDSVSGWIEFSPYDYNGNVSGVSGAPAGNASCCDWNDSLSTSGSYSCMQVHRISPPSGRGGQVLFAYNNWKSSSSAAEFGIGNFSQHFYGSTQTFDYTYTAGLEKMNASAYSVKRIEIWTKGATTPAYVRDNIVKRADGTVYHGNDENRAIITNWEYQINRPVAPPAPNTIDILYVLDMPSSEYIENTKNMSLDEFFAKSTAFMNQMLCPTDMDTNFWFRMVGVYPLDVQAQEVSPMLGRSKNSSEPGFELVNEMRNRVGADIVFSVSRNGGGIGGLAYVNSYENIVSGAAAPLGHACGFLEYYNMISWVHEIAHVMSCNHMPPDNIDVNNPRHRQFGVVVHDDNATEAPFDYRTIMTGWYYGGQTYCFSSRNHYYNGVQLSVSNHVDATQVMVELAPYVAQWRPTKVPERPEISFFPQNYAEIPAGVETKITIDYGDPDAEIYWYDATSAESKENAHLYTGPISVVGGTWKMLYAFAKTNGVEVAESEKTAWYAPTGTWGQFDYSQVLDSDGITWSMPLGDSSDFAWDKDMSIFCTGESSYQAHVDMESLTNSRPSTCSATALLTLTEARNLNFRHLDSYTNAMFSVWVDDVPVYYKKGASDTGGEWRKEVIRVESGTHRIEFVFTQTAEDMVDAQTSEGDEHALVDDEKYQRYIASLKAAETSRVWIDGFEWTPTDMIWAGDETTGDGVWTTDITYKPWEGGVSFADDAVVTFPDLAAGSPTVAVKGVVRPSKVNFTGASTAYTFVPQDDNAFIYISNGSSIEFKTNAAIRVPFRLDTAYIRSAAKCTLELGNVFGHGLTGPADEGSFWGQIGVGSKSTVIMNPGAGRVQTVGDFGKNWSYTDSDLVFTNGTVKVNGGINGGNGLFQYKRIHVKDGAVLELVTNDATGYDVAGNNTIEVERGGELKIDAGDRLRRPMKLSGGTLTVSRSGSVHALALYNAPSFTVTTDSVLTNGNASASLGFVGQDATITLQNNATLDCYVPFLSGRMVDDGKNVTIAGNGTFVQNEVMMQFTNKVTVANGVTFRQNALVFGTVGSWDVNGTLEANAIMQVKALTLASGATLSVKVTDENVSNAAIMCDTTPSLAGAIVVDAASNLANGKYAVISATGLDDGILDRVSAPTLARYATFTVEDGGLFMTVAATDTDFRTPYSWIDMYFPELVSGWGSTEYNDFATNKNHGSVKNGYAPWESYVLGLDPTNETSKFTALIRMDGTTPIVEFVPTNNTIAIQYILQGKPTLTNDWSDCLSFDEPGDTNRFFRVKVTW